MITERRYLDMSDLRALCVEHGWFTRGDNDEYGKLLNMVNNRDGSSRNITTKLLQDIASRIMQYSVTGSTEILGVTGIMYCIAERCHTCFSEVDLKLDKIDQDWNRSADIVDRITTAAQREAEELRHSAAAEMPHQYHH